MGANTSIEWCDATFNPWWGCVKVSPGCTNCYAETLSKRFGNDIWGPAKTTSRRVFGPKHWAEPFKWNAEAAKAGQRKRVFCASMADVFEAHPMLDAERAKLWVLIEATPNLDWLLLTKRPENIMSMTPDAWASGLPANVWVGTSVEDQQRADERIPELLRVPARVRFLSCEPLLGAVNLTAIIGQSQGVEISTDALNGVTMLNGQGHLPTPSIDWVIVGGESGPGARPMHPDWARGLRDQCMAAGVSFHFKQWGQWLPFVCERDEDMVGHFVGADGRPLYIADMLAHAHEIHNDRGFVKLGKHAAGRLLDGRTWDELPT